MYQLIITKKMLATGIIKFKSKSGKIKFSSDKDLRNYETEKLKVLRKIKSGIKISQLTIKEQKLI